MSSIKTTKASKQLIFMLPIIVSLITTEAQVLGLGRCPDRKTVENFNGNAYAGRWYEYSKYPFIFELFGKCVTADYTLRSDGTVHVLNNQINKLFGTQNSISGTAKIVGPGKLEVKFENIPDFGGGKYWVLGTDYVNYSAVYSCTDFFGAFSATQVWILTRQRQPSNEVVQAAIRALTAQGVSLNSLQTTNQQNCA